MSSSSPSVSPMTWGTIVLILVFIPLIIGTILTWISAARIRNSEGKLYGLRLAAISGMILPTILLIVLPFAVAAISIRIQSHSFGFLEHDAILLGFGLFITFAFLSVKIFQGCRRCILGIGTFREGFGLKKNKIIFGLLTLLWGGLGIIFYFQRPKLIDDYTTSKSPNGEFTARASTWHSMRIFTSDQTSYRFEFIDRYGNAKRLRQLPVASTGHSRSMTDFSETSDDWFSSIGTIEWEADSSEAHFLVKGRRLFRASVEGNGRGLMRGATDEVAYSSRSSKFGLVRTVTIPAPSDESNMSFLDLDTGILFQAPDEIHALMRHRFNPDKPKPINADQRFAQWAKQNGADLMVSNLEYRHLALHMGTLAEPEFEFHQTEPHIANRIHSLMHPGVLSRPSDDSLPPFTSCSLSKTHGKQTMMFATREGGIGVMEFLEETKNPAGIKIRYMLLDH